MRDSKQILRRALASPDVVKCLKCDGLGTTIVGNDNFYLGRWNRRTLRLCQSCVQTGLSAIPVSEVIEE